MKQNRLNVTSCILPVLILTAGIFMAACDSPSGPGDIDFSDIPVPQSEQIWLHASLDGEAVVPPVETTATSSLQISVSWMEGSLFIIVYEFYVDNMKRADVTGFEIHQGKGGEDGKVLAFLDKASYVTIGDEEGRLRIFVQLLPDESDPLNQVTADQLVKEMRNWNTYADIHTIDHPNGEIRGPIKPGPLSRRHI
jgi:CHRD domain